MLHDVSETDETKKMNSIASYKANNVPDNINSAGSFGLIYINIFCGVCYKNIDQRFGDSVFKRYFLASVALIPQRFEDFIGCFLLPGGTTFFVQENG
nr:hypothetical protein [Rhodoferax sp.]